jgi:hypothetical protein
MGFINLTIPYGSRSQWPCGLRRGSWPVGCWDRGFESRSRQGCLSAFFCVVLSCVGRGLATGWSLVQGVLPHVQIAQETSYMWGGRGPSRTVEPQGKNAFQMFYIISIHYFVSFVVHTAMTMSTLVFWVVTPCGHFSPEDGYSMFLRNVGIYLQVHRALLPRIPTSTNQSCKIAEKNAFGKFVYSTELLISAPVFFLVFGTASFLYCL